MKSLVDQLERTKLQAASNKADFVKERKDRLETHNKIADLGKLNKRLSAQVKELTEENTKLVAKHEEMKIRGENLGVKYKQCKKEAETLHAQLRQSAQSLANLSQEMNQKHKRSRKKTDAETAKVIKKLRKTLPQFLSSSAIFFSADMSPHSGDDMTIFEGELRTEIEVLMLKNDELVEESKQLRRFNKDLTEVLTAGPKAMSRHSYGSSSSTEEPASPTTEEHTAGAGNMFDNIPKHEITPACFQSPPSSPMEEHSPTPAADHDYVNLPGQFFDSTRPLQEFLQQRNLAASQSQTTRPSNSSGYHLPLDYQSETTYPQQASNSGAQLTHRGLAIGHVKQPVATPQKLPTLNQQSSCSTEQQSQQAYQQQPHEAQSPSVSTTTQDDVNFENLTNNLSAQSGDDITAVVKEQTKTNFHADTDNEIEQDTAAEVIEQVSGDQTHYVTDTRHPYDPNSICTKNFRIQARYRGFKFT